MIQFASSGFPKRGLESFQTNVLRLIQKMASTLKIAHYGNLNSLQISGENVPGEIGICQDF